MPLALPDFPWDLLTPYGDKARTHPGGIVDLSVGSLTALCAVVSGTVLKIEELPVEAAILLAVLTSIGVGVVCGFINGAVWWGNLDPLGEKCRPEVAGAAFDEMCAQATASAALNHLFDEDA